MSVQIAPETYTIQEGDTLATIAAKLDISLLHLKEQNPKVRKAKPGIVINCKRSRRIPNLHPIDSQIFSKVPPIDGDLLLDDTVIRFKPRKRHSKPITIDLMGFIDATITPHPIDFYDDVDELLPDDFLALLCVNYLTNPSDPSSIELMQFAGLHQELQDYKIVLEQKAAAIQKRANFTRPLMSNYIKPEPVKEKKVSDFSLEFEGMADPSEILLPNQMSQLKGQLPKRLRIYDWHLIYRLSTDGSSYNEFLAKTSGKESCIVLIKLDSKAVIGCYSASGFDKKKSYYSNGETFVFSFYPAFMLYKWSKTVKYFINVDKTCMSIGGGGSAAIYVDDRMLRGFSEKCDAFNNPPLAPTVDFKILNIEVWHIAFK